MEPSYLSESELREEGFAQVGKSVLISKYARFYGKSMLSISDFTRIDDFTVISVASPSTIGKYVHIASHVVVTSPLPLTIGEYSTISSRCAIYGQSDDYSGKFLTNPTLPQEFRGVEKHVVDIGGFVIIGTGSTVLPGCSIAEGTALGAMSLLKTNTEPWAIYAGVPAIKLRDRSKECLKYIQ